MSNEKQQTAVEWLISKVNKQSWGDFRIDIPNEIIEQAKEMEKLQMILFACDVHMDIKKDRVKSLMELVEEMYNKTYGGNK
jgi:hypothetical protein